MYPLKKGKLKVHFLSCKAFGQAYSTQRKVAEDGETNEETLLQESASKEAYYMGRLLELQSELKHCRATTSNAQAENEHLSTVLQELREVQYLQYHITPHELGASLSCTPTCSRPDI